MTDAKLTDERIAELKKKLNSTAWVDDADADALVAALDELAAARKRLAGYPEVPIATLTVADDNSAIVKSMYSYLPTGDHDVYLPHMDENQPAAEPPGEAIATQTPHDPMCPHCTQVVLPEMPEADIRLCDDQLVAGVVDHDQRVRNLELLQRLEDMRTPIAILPPTGQSCK